MTLSITSIYQSYLNVNYFLHFFASSPSIALCFLLVPLPAGCFFCSYQEIPEIKTNIYSFHIFV